MNFLRRSIKTSHFSSLSRRKSKPPPQSQFLQRPYYTSRRPELEHFRRRGPIPSGGGGGYSFRRHLLQNPRALFAVTVISGGVVSTVYFSNLEYVPYTKRSHLILLSPSLERHLGESEFSQLKSALRTKILPSIHPDSIRVRLIASEIIDALHRGLHQSEERRWSDIDYSSADESAGPAHRSTAVSVLEKESPPPPPPPSSDITWGREDEVLDDRWVRERRKEKHGARPAAAHLEGLNWEVVVVREKAVNAFCLPGGKIVVFTGLLDHFRSDAEIATVIGHEVGHAVARHAAEGITKNLWLALLQLIALQLFGMPDLISALSHYALRLPFTRRMEIEADYIGLLLLASAGYDPRVAPKVYEKLGQLTGDSALRDYFATHPSSKTRAKLLSQAQVMDEALAIYRESVAGRGVGGFL